jgi:hypothetical protein
MSKKPIELQVEVEIERNSPGRFVPNWKVRSQLVGLALWPVLWWF